MEELLMFDNDGDGHLSEEEVTQMIIIQDAFETYDKDSSGQIDAKEFAAMLRSLDAEIDDVAVADALDALDSDHSGTIGRKEFFEWWLGKFRGDNEQMELNKKLAKIASTGKQEGFKDVHSSAWLGDVGAVKRFIQAKASLANAIDSTTFGGRNTPLHYAAYEGHLEVVNVLVNAGAKVNARNESGVTAVFFAAQMGHNEVVDFLVLNGADLSIADNNYNFTAFDVCKSKSTNKILRESPVGRALAVPAAPKNAPVVSSRHGTKIEIEFESEGGGGGLVRKQRGLPITGYIIRLVEGEELEEVLQLNVFPGIGGKMSEGTASSPFQSKQKQKKKKDPAAGVRVSEKSDGTKVFSKTITGLVPATEYFVQIAAVNSMGASEFSPMSAPVFTLSRPPQVQAVELLLVPPRYDRIRVSWEVPTEVPAAEVAHAERALVDHEDEMKAAALGVDPSPTLYSNQLKPRELDFGTIKSFIIKAKASHEADFAKVRSVSHVDPKQKGRKRRKGKNSNLSSNVTADLSAAIAFAKEGAEEGAWVSTTLQRDTMERFGMSVGSTFEFIVAAVSEGGVGRFSEPVSCHIVDAKSVAKRRAKTSQPAKFKVNKLSVNEKKKYKKQKLSAKERKALHAGLKRQESLHSLHEEEKDEDDLEV